MSFANFMVWYHKLDQDTIKLFTRFIAKGVATGDINAYVKRVLQTELNTIEVQPTEGENNGRS